MYCATPVTVQVCGSTSTVNQCRNISVITVPEISSSGACADTDMVLLVKTEYDALSQTNGPFKATPDDYAALSIIFGVVLAAAAIVWGLKQVLNLFRTAPES
jgi:hypothetical protein